MMSTVAKAHAFCWCLALAFIVCLSFGGSMNSDDLVSQSEHLLQGNQADVNMHSKLHIQLDSTLRLQLLPYETNILISGFLQKRDLQYVLN